VNHVQAKEIVDSHGLSPAEGLFVRGVAWHETNYGQGWKPGEGAGSHNMGAITDPSPDELSFKHVDSRFDAKKGKLVEYVTWFKGYEDDDAGFRDLEKTVLKDNVKEALAAGDVSTAVEAMYDNGYYKGVHPDREGNIADYQNAVSRAMSAITGATGEAPIVPLDAESGSGEPC
jgi:hypothetical protein